MTRSNVTAILILLLVAAANFGCSGTEEPESVVGDCQAGAMLRAGEGCTVAHVGDNATFWVKQDGSACYSVERGGGVFSFSSSTCGSAFLNEDAISVAKNDDGSWTVVSVP